MKHSHENSAVSRFGLARASHVVIALALFALTAGADRCAPPPPAVSITITEANVGTGIACSGNFHVAADVTNDLNAGQNVALTVGALNNVDPGPTVEMADGSGNFFRALATKKVIVRGKLTNPCANGSFTLTGTGASGGTGIKAFTVNAIPIFGTAPGGVTPDATGKFEYGNGTNDAIALQCCGGAANNVTFQDNGGSNVSALTITPAQQVCNGPAAFVQPKVEGRLSDLYQRGIAGMIVRSPAAESCTLITEIEPAQ